MTTKTSTKRASTYKITAVLSILALALSGCGESTTNDADASWESIEYDADQETYVEALSEMDEVTFVMQSTATQGAQTGRRFEEYAEAVTEWSGGKIDFEIVYSNGIAPPEEVDDAIADGRIDIGSVMPALEPSEFPTHEALSDVSFIGKQTPIDGLLQWHGAMFDIAAQTEEIDEEYENKGLELLVPHFSSGSTFAQCSETTTAAEDFNDKVIATQSTVQRLQSEALGMSPTTLSYAEMFEGLERGVVNCAISNLTVASLQGLVEPAPHFAFDPDVGIGNAGGTLAISQDKWDALPLPAQQLMFDRLDIFLTATLESAWENISIAAEESAEFGGGFETFDEDVTSQLEAVNNNVLEDLRSNAHVSDPETFVDGIVEAEARWETIIDDLNIENADISYQDLPGWYEEGRVDLDSYFEALWSETWTERRPS